ncbi:hypothetical protein [Streptomyces microflavus]|uniref:hypothetical protein n=1 Tax=Streptomyces microflavus TaxID=1919 RepID=UPI0033AA0D84
MNRYVAAMWKDVVIPVRALTPSCHDVTSWIMRSEETLSPELTSDEFEEIWDAARREITARPS